MGETSEQVRPLAPATERQSSDEEESATITGLRRKRWFKCFACVVVLLLIQAIVIVVLIFTVFRVKDPIIRLNAITIERLDLINGTTPRPGSNMTLIADVSVKNPNFASFRYQNTTTTLSYRGTVIGEARGPPGRARARRTMRMNTTVEIITNRLLAQPELRSDINSSMLTVSSYTRVGGKVRMIVKKHVTVALNCSMAFNLTSRAIQQQKCRRKVKL